MSVTITSTANCPKCDATERAVKRRGIANFDGYSKAKLEEKTAQEQEEFLAWARSQNFNSFPVVVTDTPVGSWGGYQPEKLLALAEYLSEHGTLATSAQAEKVMA